MRVNEYAVFGVRQPELDRIILTRTERALLSRTADLLEHIRDARNARVPTDWYAGDEDDSDLAFGWRICHDLAEKGSLDAELVR